MPKKLYVEIGRAEERIAYFGNVLDALVTFRTWTDGFAELITDLRKEAIEVHEDTNPTGAENVCGAVMQYSNEPKGQVSVAVGSAMEALEEVLNGATDLIDAIDGTSDLAARHSHQAFMRQRREVHGACMRLVRGLQESMPPLERLKGLIAGEHWAGAGG